MFKKALLFATAAAAYPTLVEYATKGILSVASIFRPDFVLTWYDFNHSVIRNTPYVGEQALALMRTWLSDGDLVFWQVWFGLSLLALPVVFVRWAYRRLTKPRVNLKPRGAP